MNLRRLVIIPSFIFLLASSNCNAMKIAASAAPIVQVSSEASQAPETLVYSEEGLGRRHLDLEALLKRIHDLGRVDRLMLIGCVVYDYHLIDIATACPKLKRLSFRSCSIISGMPCSLSNTINFSEFSAYGVFRDVTTLSLEDCNNSLDAQVACGGFMLLAAACPNIQNCLFADCRTLNDHVLGSILYACCTSVSNLSLLYCLGITDAAFSLLLKLMVMLN